MARQANSETLLKENASSSYGGVLCNRPLWLVPNQNNPNKPVSSLPLSLHLSVPPPAAAGRSRQLRCAPLPQSTYKTFAARLPILAVKWITPPLTLPRPCCVSAPHLVKSSPAMSIRQVCRPILFSSLYSDLAVLFLQTLSACLTLGPPRDWFHFDWEHKLFAF